MLKILDFYADWCQPCKQMAPILEDISESLNITIEKIDIEENDDEVALYGIRNIPTLLIFKDNNLVDKVVGAVSKSKLLETLNKHL